MSVENPRNVIIEVLKQHPEGLTISSIAEKSGLHRHTSRKYINELISSKEIIQRTVGAAKLCYINCADNEKNIGKRGFFQRFNLKIIMTVVIITFLLSEVAIFAYDNNSLNETVNNFSNTSLITSSVEFNSSNASKIIEDAIKNSSNSTVETNDSLTSSTNATDEYNDSSSYAINESNISQIIDNISNQIENISLNITNETVNVILDIQMEYPQKITRGETFTVKIHVKNVGFLTAKGVVASLQLPEGFNLVPSSSDCDKLDPTESCISEVNVTSTLSADLGNTDFKTVVNYEE